MTDRIHLRDLALKATIGVFDFERRAPQNIVVSVTLHCDLRPAGRSDRLSETVNYAAIENALVVLVETSSFELLEALAEAMARHCFSCDARIERVDALVEKPGALLRARTVAVEISRTRKDFLERNSQ